MRCIVEVDLQKSRMGNQTHRPCLAELARVGLGKPQAGFYRTLGIATSLFRLLF